MTHPTTDEIIEGVRLDGKVAIVTGASTGLGRETARALEAAGAHVVGAVRDPSKGAPGAEVAQLDLASLQSVREFAEWFLGSHDRLHLLINNAGVMACPLDRTADGFEMQFGTNHLGHFLLTNLLTPALVADPPSRIVNLSSRGHLVSDLIWDDPNFERTEYRPWTAYGQSKTANVLFTVELQRRLAPMGVTAYAVHPGAIQTELGRHLTQDTIQEMIDRYDGQLPTFKSIPEGAATTVWAATADGIPGGRYLEDCGIGEPAPYAIDPVAAEKLWAMSEELVK